MGIRQLTKDENGITLIAGIGLAILLLSGAGLVALGVNALVGGEADTTYNITDTGFSLAGLEIDSFYLVALAVIIILAVLWVVFGRKK